MASDLLADVFPYEEQKLLNRRLTDGVVELGLALSLKMAESGIRNTLGYADYEHLLNCKSIGNAAEWLQHTADFAMNPMPDRGTLEQTLSNLDAAALQGGALYIITSMPPEDLERSAADYLRGLNCSLNYLVLRPEEEAPRGENMKIITLRELEEHKR